MAKVHCGQGSLKENPAGIGTRETLDQWRAFDASWKEFHVIVPERCLEEAEKSARDNLITVDRWWYLDI
ncbi:MAG: hypothetical protein HPY90_12370 [Syntrophothermus sp.]|uniref:hypothetical protein n=1 Tax=Syntrophothermus sp. TaxID=2736299 RepID=UPI00257F62F5|nr:hypothetical protein [Syntrophothermus sp.]NSW84045.1 hypothetical protein [Syntrophothermus sp.]